MVTGAFFSESGAQPIMSEVMFVYFTSFLGRVWKLPMPFVEVAQPRMSFVLREVATNSWSCLAGGKTFGRLPGTVPMVTLVPSSSLCTYSGIRGLVVLVVLKSTSVTSL